MKFSIVLGLLVIIASTNASPSYSFDDICYCQPVDEWEFGEPSCVPSQSNGLWVAADTCTYECTAPGFMLPEGANNVRTCRPALEHPDVDTDQIYIWVPEEPTCVRNPDICIAVPFWEEVPPGDIAGTIDCGTLSTEEDEYPVGHECTYQCPAGYRLEGNPTAECVTDPDGGFFTPRSPCCEELCPPSDVLFVLDWSTSIDQTEWGQMLLFVRQLVSDLRDNGVRNRDVRFGVEIFGNGVQNRLNILPFREYSEELIEDIDFLEFNGQIEGTTINEALRYATEDVFGNPASGVRPNARNVVIFVTDGSSTDGRVVRANGQTPTVDALHAVADIVYSVGIGFQTLPFNSVTAEEDARAIAEPPSNFALIESFELLNGEPSRQIVRQICSFACEDFQQIGEER